MKIEGNEEADKTAKIGTLKICCAADTYVSLFFMKKKIKENYFLNWQSIWKTQKVGKHNIHFGTVPKWRPSSLKLSKQLWSTITQLKLGVGYFRYYLSTCLTQNLLQSSDYKIRATEPAFPFVIVIALVFYCLKV